MKRITLQFHAQGGSSMLLHSDRGSNPIHPDTVAHKALTSKRKKTDEDHYAIARSEYLLGFYGGAPIRIPSVNIKSAIVEGAKLNKLGSAFNRSVLILQDFIPIAHDGPDTPEQMWENPDCVDGRSVKIGTARLMRYRPKLNNWQLGFDVVYHENMIEAQQIVTAAENAGRYIGLGDYRPAKGGNFGRFDVTVINGQ